METYTIAAAARLVGTAKGKLYQAVRSGRLQATTGPELGDVLMVTAEALQDAGFTVPASVLAPAQPQAVSVTAAAPAPEIILAPAQESAPEPSAPEQALIAHLERALEAAQTRENRLLDLLAQLTKSQNATPVSSVSAGRSVATTPPHGSLRQQILAVVRTHPEGVSPQAVRTSLQLDREVRSTMKGMVRSGLLRRLEAGRYVVTVAGEEA